MDWTTGNEALFDQDIQLVESIRKDLEEHLDKLVLERLKAHVNCAIKWTLTEDKKDVLAWADDFRSCYKIACSLVGLGCFMPQHHWQQTRMAHVVKNIPATVASNSLTCMKLPHSPPTNYLSFKSHRIPSG